MANASVLLQKEALRQKLQYFAFKRSGPALGAAISELGEDLYRLQHLAPVPEGEASPVFIDVGASIGIVSVLLCKRWANARVIALEPAPSNFRYLLWNLRVNGVTDCVWPLNIAAGGTPLATKAFFYSPTYPTWTQLAGGDELTPEDDSWRGGWPDWQIRFESETVTLAEVIAAFGLGDIHFLKVDCEGCEWDIFAPHTWARLQHRIRNVATELHSWALPASAPEGLEEAVRRTVCVHEVTRENTLCSTH
ncbi:unnamed protein product [Polarella glacialis]|uniref:Methyltransferase FkbM domain-containing protein n=1 Tax=Polarella glacialis TaxID=89957 RepID=A0A813G4C4_POLGL|nr:unnamed protein product [Polarella glacialis]